MANKSRQTADLVSAKTGIAVTISGDPVVLGVGNTELVRVAGNGYVGIATANPTSKLDVYGDGDGDRINFVNAQLWLRPNTGGSIGTALELGVLDTSASSSQYSVLTADAYANTAEFLDASDLLDIRSNRYNSYIHLSHADPVGVRTAFSIRHSYGGGSSNNDIRIHDASEPATRIRLASNTYSYITNRVGIGSTIPNSDVDLDIGNGVNVGSLGTAFYIKKDGRIGIGTTVSTSTSQTDSKIFIDVVEENRKLIALRGSIEHKWSGEVSTGSSLGGGTYDPPGTLVSIQNDGNRNIGGNALVHMVAYESGAKPTGIYFGASPGSTVNGPADFVLGRRVAAQHWRDTLRITHAGDNNKQFLGFGTDKVPTYTPIYVAGSMQINPYNVTGPKTTVGLTTAMDLSNNFKVQVLDSFTNSTGIATIASTGGSPDAYDYVKRYFRTNATQGNTAFNQDLCQIDCSGANFQQFWIYIRWGTRIQGVTDAYVQINQRAYGANKFNSATGSFNITQIWSNTSGHSTSHMDIEVVDNGSGVLAIEYQQSSTPGTSSFIFGYIEIMQTGGGSLGQPNSGIVKWNI